MQDIQNIQTIKIVPHDEGGFLYHNVSEEYTENLQLEDFGNMHLALRICNIENPERKTVFENPQNCPVVAEIIQELDVCSLKEGGLQRLSATAVARSLQPGFNETASALQPYLTSDGMDAVDRELRRMGNCWFPGSHPPRR